jgi:hypothetical protein
MKNESFTLISIMTIILLMSFSCAKTDVPSDDPSDNLIEPGDSITEGWNPTIIDDAIGENLVAFTPGLSWANNILHSSKAMYILALASYDDPDIAGADGTKAKERLLQHIRNMISGGKEPGCRGGIAGWVDNAAAQSLVLAKNTSAVWNELTANEKQKCDFIMKCLAISGNYCQNAQNNPATDLFAEKSWKKTWNPNHQEGYVGVMIAAFEYFEGAANVDSILQSFNYDDYMATINDYGFSNIKTNFTATGKTLMESGGTDAFGGTTLGVKIPFTYYKQPDGPVVAYEPFAIYKALADRFYSLNCQSIIYNGSGTKIGYIYNGRASPHEGQAGMAAEFKSSDMNGVRSSARYVYDGWRNSVITRATMETLDYWGTGTDRDEVASKMEVGSEDLIFKLIHGYRGWSNGKPVGPHYEFKGHGGYDFVKEVWNKKLK